MSASKLAILVIDMQGDFIDDGAPVECPGGRDIIPSIQTLLSAARAKGVPVIYTQETHRAEKVDFGLELMGNEPEHCLEGTPGVEIVSDLAMQPGDFLIKKRRYSAFFATDLDILLRGLRSTHIILTGVASDVCVQATALDAYQHDYQVIVPTECVAGTNLTRHEAALANISYLLGRICPLNEVLSIIDAI